MNSLSWSPYWITIPMGLIMFVYLVYELRYSPKAQDQASGAENASSIERFSINPFTMMSIMFIMWLGLCAWLLIISTKVSSIRSDVNCFVMPRSLTGEQISRMGEFLSKSDPHEIIMNQVENDDEAGSYRGDFYKAFQEGGWTIASVNVVPLVHQDISLHYSEPLQTPPPREDPKHPIPHTIVLQAMKYADVMNNGFGSESSGAITKYSLSLSIGHRRRDGFACAEARNKHRQERLLRGLVD